ncbi:MAG: hypothetical protein LBS03_10510 [Bacteroidales bacterium]|jgi:hypothetical protein|nr:hypothetical protein [Bacteroidales bacterium]
MRHLRHFIKNITGSLLPVVFTLGGCHTAPETKTNIDRMEQRLFSIPTDSVEAAVPHLRLRYGRLFELYNNRIIAIGPSTNPQYPQKLIEFLTDSRMYATYRKVMAYYPDVTDLEKELTAAFSRYHKYFPNRDIPSVYTLISGFNQSMSVDEGLLAISLDKYLGMNEDYYIGLDIPAYQRRLMDKPYIVPDCMKAMAYTEFPDTDTVNTVLSSILYEGKIAYFVSRMLPALPDSLIFGYTAAQMQWCKNNTRQMWTFLVEKKMLYRTDYLTIAKLVKPAPFTSFFTRESPGRAAVWLGYQIIQSYVASEKLSLDELMNRRNDPTLLSKAKFRP